MQQTTEYLSIKISVSRHLPTSIHLVYWLLWKKDFGGFSPSQRTSEMPWKFSQLGCFRTDTGSSSCLAGGCRPLGEEEKVRLLSARCNSCCGWPSGLDQRGLLCLVLISSDEHSAPVLPFIFPAKQTAGTYPALVGIHSRLYKWLWGR